MLWNMIKNRLGEASTWKGLISLATGLGLQLSGQQADAIVAAMVAIYAALSVVLPDTFNKK
mgnify:CR=1 FL=1